MRTPEGKIIPILVTDISQVVNSDGKTYIRTNFLTDNDGRDVMEGIIEKNRGVSKGSSFSLSSVKKDLPFLSGNAWNEKKPKDPSQN